MPVGPADAGSLIDNASTDSNLAIELVTISEAAARLTVSVPTMRRLQQRRAIRFIKIGGSVRFDTCDLMAYLDRCRVESVD